ncbi:UNVERIFIED_CONTAM: hypothetical protein HDU68_003478, partial [Siphonaria sp. JEL0065]
MAVAAAQIADDKEVVAVYGDFDGRVTVAAVLSYYKLPFCGPTQVQIPLLDKIKYPYFMQMQQVSKTGTAFLQLLKVWNCTRVAVISTLNDMAQIVVNELQKNDIDILTRINLSHSPMNNVTVMQIADTLSLVDARYIILLASTDTTAFVYYSLANMTRSVGPKYVWLSSNLPFPAIDPVAAWGKNYYKTLKGFVSAFWYAFPNEYTAAYGKAIAKQASAATGKYNFTVTMGALEQTVNLYQSYDCVQLLATGMHQMMTKNGLSPTDFQARNLQSYFNYSIFTNTGYRGISSDPVQLTEFGDIAAPYLYMAMTGADPNFDYNMFAMSDPDVSTIMSLEGTNDFKFLFYNGTKPPHDGRLALVTFTESALFSNSGKGSLTVAFMAVGLVLCLFLFPTTHFWTKPKGNVTFLQGVNVAATLAFASMAFHLNRPTVTTCHLKTWFQVFAFGATTSAYFAKNLRIWIVYNSKTKLSPIWANNLLYMGIAGAMAFVDALLLIVWSLTSKPVLNKVENNAKATYTYTCEVNASYTSTNILWAYNIILLIGLFAMGFMTWNVGPVHNESLFLLLATLSFTIGVAIIFAIEHVANPSEASSLLHAYTI